MLVTQLVQQALIAGSSMHDDPGDPTADLSSSANARLQIGGAAAARETQFTIGDDLTGYTVCRDGRADDRGTPPRLCRAGG
jgi:hypothetical protein